MYYMEGFDSNDFVYVKNGGNITSGGFSINSLLFKSDVSPMTTMNSISGGAKDNAKFSDMFNNLAIPVGLTSFKGIRNINDEKYAKESNEATNESNEATNESNEATNGLNEATNESNEATNGGNETIKIKKSKKTKNNKKFIKKTKRLKFAPSVTVKG